MIYVDILSWTRLNFINSYKNTEIDKYTCL